MGETELTYWGSRCGSVHVVLAVQVHAGGPGYRQCVCVLRVWLCTAHPTAGPLTCTSTLVWGDNCGELSLFSFP